MSVRLYFLCLALHVRLSRLLTVLAHSRRSDVTAARKTLTAADFRVTGYPISPALAAACVAAVARCEQFPALAIPAPRTAPGWGSLSNR